MNNRAGKTEQENLKDENDFLKMKMMLEHGANFHFGGSAPPAIENDFLKWMIEFENQRANPVYITVFKKIGSPEHFKPPSEISDADIQDELSALVDYLNKNGIDVDALSPNIGDRELYRFIIEELFVHETEDMHIPGMMTCFIYDEFHPDHKYDNTKHAVSICIEPIFRKEPIEFLYVYDEKCCQLNQHDSLTGEEIKNIINRFKDLFDEILVHNIEVENCLLETDNCIVKGNYSVDLISHHDIIHIENKWMVEFAFVNEFWNIVNVQIDGLAI